MDKLQTQITEYIEPYMNKTLSEGCYVKVYNEIDNYHKWDSEIGRFLEWDIDSWTYMTSDFVTQQLDYHNPIILGHYDITAVLKYMLGETTFVWNIFYYDWQLALSIWAKDDDGYLYSYTRKIPNKPLNLYSEQENKDLLELLKKLQKDNNKV